MSDILVYTIAPTLIVGATIYTIMHIDAKEQRQIGFEDGLNAAEMVRKSQKAIKNLLNDIDKKMDCKNSEPQMVVNIDVDDMLSNIKQAKSNKAKPKRAKAGRPKNKPTPARTKKN